MAQSTGISWSDVPLRSGLGRLGELQRVAIIVDRRVDPDQLVSLSVTDKPLLAVLGEVAAAAQARVAQLGGVVYLGPPAASSELPTLAAIKLDEARALPRKWQTQLVVRRAWSWPDLVTPRELVAQLAEEVGCEVVGGDLLPHDLWAAAEVPPSTLIDRLTLVLYQFDLTYTIQADAGRLQIVPIERPVRCERRYPTGRDAEETLARIARLAPEAQAHLESGHVVVLGTLDEHARIAGRGTSPPPAVPRSPSEARSVYTLKLASVSLTRFVAELNKQQSQRVEIDTVALAASGIATDALVTVDVREVSLAELVTAAVAPLGLVVQQQPSRLWITTADN